LVAKSGRAIEFRVDVHHDREAGVYIATSPDLRGLVVEADSMDQLMEEVRGAVEMLLDFQLSGRHVPVTPEYRYRGDAICAA